MHMARTYAWQCYAHARGYQLRRYTIGKYASWTGKNTLMRISQKNLTAKQDWEHAESCANFYLLLNGNKLEQSSTLRCRTLLAKFRFQIYKWLLQ